MENSEKYKVCILGVGFVGLTLAACLSDAGHDVYALDTNPNLIMDLNALKTDVLEPKLADILQEGLEMGTLKFIHSSENLDDLKKCNYFVITVGTPLKEGVVDDSMIRNAIDSIINHIQVGSTIILRSTTKIGTGNRVIKPYLEASGKSIYLAMCPERTIEGRALEELTSLPQIIGADDEASYRSAKLLFDSMGVEVVRVSSLMSAEAAKLINNTYRDLMFGFSNEIALLCSKIGLSAIEIINAANYNYSRSNIALPGPSGGPCLEKDPWILAEAGFDAGLVMQITRASRKTNEDLPVAFLSDHLIHADSIKKIAILGLSFKGKPEVLDLRGSPAIAIVNYLHNTFSNAQIVGFEPAGMFNAAIEHLNQEANLEEAVSDSNIVVLTHNHVQFQNIEQLIMNEASESCQVFDFWNLLSPSKLGTNQSYRSLG